MKTLMMLLCITASAVLAQEPVQEGKRQHAERMDTQSLIAAEQRARTAERLLFKRHFEAAYEAYPAIPEGLLEALAFTASRWTHLQHEDAVDSHHGKPNAWGVMGFYEGRLGFANTLQAAADALGVSSEVVKHDPRTNIMAGAALLSSYIYEADHATTDVEDLAPIIARFAGLPQAQSKVARFTNDAHVYDVLLALDRGHDDHGINFNARPIDWTRVFDGPTLQQMKAPFVRLNPETDSVHIPGYEVEIRDEVLVPDGTESAPQAKAVDYPGALWVSSPYNWARSSSVTDVTIHTAQGSYAGTINWFTNNPYSVSAHYVVRSSDGQITQMVREYRKAAHVGVHNGYTVGIEHEGYVSSSSWYTNAMYNASGALTKDICAGNSINTATAYDGPSSSSVSVLSTSIRIKGHQHYSSQTHTDPGIYWDWPRYKTLVNGGSGGGSGSSVVLDNFESSEGHFYSTPTYSGSTYGISTSSTATRTSSISHTGSYSEQIKFVDDSSTSSSWGCRFLSGGGSTGNNVSLSRSGGKVGFWVYSGGTGMSAALGIDDSDGTERSISRSIPANTWTFLEWRLDDSSQWNAWYGGNGAISASSVTLDAIWFYRANTSYNVYVYIDDVTYSN